MAEHPDPDRLRALEARLAQVRGKVADKPKGGAVASFSQGEVAWRMVIELVSGMLLGLSIGYGLDWLFGTLPIFLLIFGLFGFVAGVKVMIRTAADMNNDPAAAPQGEKNGAALPPGEGDGRG